MSDYERDDTYRDDPVDAVIEADLRAEREAEIHGLTVGDMRVEQHGVWGQGTAEYRAAQHAAIQRRHEQRVARAALTGEARRRAWQAERRALDTE